MQYYVHISKADEASIALHDYQDAVEELDYDFYDNGHYRFTFFYDDDTGKLEKLDLWDDYLEWVEKAHHETLSPTGTLSTSQLI